MNVPNTIRDSLNFIQFFLCFSLSLAAHITFETWRSARKFHDVCDQSYFGSHRLKSDTERGIASVTFRTGLDDSVKQMSYPSLMNLMCVRVRICLRVHIIF